MEYVGEETLVEEESGDGGWVETHQLNDDGTTQLEDKICELTMEETKVRTGRRALKLPKGYFRNDNYNHN